MKLPCVGDTGILTTFLGFLPLIVCFNNKLFPFVSDTTTKGPLIYSQQLQQQFIVKKMNQKDPPENTFTVPERSVAYRIVYNADKDMFDFQTAVIVYGNEDAEVHLISTVHVAEDEYFCQIQRDSKDLDLMLYELITSKDNIIIDPETNNKRLKSQLLPTPTLEKMAMLHGLSPQLSSLNYLESNRWVLSDIDKESLVSIQQSIGESAIDSIQKTVPFIQHVSEISQIFWKGFAYDGKLLPKFSFENDGLVQILRLGLWMVPCPEPQLILLDWAKRYPPAGGFSNVLRSMVGALANWDFLALRRLALSQILLSGEVLTATGEGKPQETVLVGERNSKVLLDVDQALSQGYRKIGVLYGGLHIQDLERKVGSYIGLPRKSVSWRTAWAMPAFRVKGRVLVNMLCVVLPVVYLLVDAFDWNETFGHIAATLSNEGLEGWRSVVTILGSYLLRHVYLYYGMTRWIVQWDKTLFQI